MSLKYVQTLTLYQAGAGNIIGATSVVLTSLTDIYGNAITTMTPFGAKGYITLEPDTSNEEAASFTGITVNANGTVSLTGVSTMLAQSSYTETSGLVRTHSGGTKVVVTDNVGFWNTFANKNNAETILGKYTFPNTSRPTLDSDVDTAVVTDFPTFGQLSRVVVAGAANASTSVKGIVQEATQAQLLAKTAAGSTGAELYVNPATLPSTLLSDYKVDTGAANAYVITPAPAITAYTTGQIFSFKAVNANTTASTLNVNALGTKAIVNSKGGVLIANDILAGMLVTVEYDGTSMVMQNPVANTPTTAQTFKFGGTGADGALSVSSGNTNIDCASAAVVVKNYSSISITGTGSITFINPHANGTIVILKSQGGVTLTSSATPMIDASGNGASGNGLSSVFETNGGGSGAVGGPVGAGGAVPVALYASAFSQFLLKYATVLVGGGGGAGMASANGGTATAGSGGRGGGGLVIECAGAWNFTTASGISVAGKNGTNASHTTTGFASGGGGGAGGFFLGLYNTLTANSGTITVTAGTGGTSANTSGNTTYGGGGGGLIAAGASGGSSTSDGVKTGGDGAVGFSLVAANTEFE